MPVQHCAQHVAGGGRLGGAPTYAKAHWQMQVFPLTPVGPPLRTMCLFYSARWNRHDLLIYDFILIRHTHSMGTDLQTDRSKPLVPSWEFNWQMWHCWAKAQPDLMATEQPPLSLRYRTNFGRRADLRADFVFMRDFAKVNICFQVVYKRWRRQRSSKSDDKYSVFLLINVLLDVTPTWSANQY